MERSSERGLRALLTVLGLVMLVAGLVGVVFGASEVPRPGTITPDVDTEMRFFSVWYVVTGVVLLRSLRHLASAGATVRLIAMGFGVAGCARIASWIAVGRPDSRFIVLMVVELLIPFVVIPWHAFVAPPHERASDAGHLQGGLSPEEPT